MIIITLNLMIKVVMIITVVAAIWDIIIGIMLIRMIKKDNIIIVIMIRIIEMI